MIPLMVIHDGLPNSNAVELWCSTMFNFASELNNFFRKCTQQKMQNEDRKIELHTNRGNMCARQKQTDLRLILWALVHINKKNRAINCMSNLLVMKTLSSKDANGFRSLALVNFWSPCAAIIWAIVT